MMDCRFATRSFQSPSLFTWGFTCSVAAAATVLSEHHCVFKEIGLATAKRVGQN